ncbi:MAG: DUF167 domain-containing protein [Candidatus Berkelbacteria bacterium]
MKITVTVHANSSKQDFSHCDNGEFVAYLRSKPVDNEANAELIELASEYFDRPKSLIKIIIGHNNKKKVLDIG